MCHFSFNAHDLPQSVNSYLNAHITSMGSPLPATAGVLLWLWHQLRLLPLWIQEKHVLCERQLYKNIDEVVQTDLLLNEHERPYIVMSGALSSKLLAVQQVETYSEQWALMNVCAHSNTYQFFTGQGWFIHSFVYRTSR